MFAVLFEVAPYVDQWDAYLGYARMLRPELEQIDGFVTNIRYRSLTREGWLLSLSDWRDEKALIRWRTHPGHHAIQEKGRFEVFRDYHLRVGQLTQDSKLPDGYALQEQRLDETDTGEGTAVTLVDAQRAPDWVSQSSPEDVATWLGLKPDADGLLSWDVFDAVLTPGNVIVLLSWRDHTAAEAFERDASLPDGARVRQVRVIRDYSLFDRREAPQYYAEVKQRATNAL
jgi:heme-degrading monooxygenase HmoA